MPLIDPRFLNGKQKRRRRQLFRVQRQCFQWWRGVLFNERLRSIMTEEADEPDYEPINSLGVVRSRRSVKYMESSPQPRRKQMQSTAVMPPQPNPFRGYDSEEVSATTGCQIFQKRSGVMTKMQKESAFSIGSFCQQRNW